MTVTLRVTGLQSSETKHMLSKRKTGRKAKTPIRRIIQGRTWGRCVRGGWGRSRVYVHFRWTIDGPDSSYSPLVTHISSKVEREAKIDPPIQTEYLRSGGATILMVMDWGAKLTISFLTRSSIPVNIVVPPDRTTL